MEPIEFKEANKELARPSSMTDEECGPLPVFVDERECISKWNMTFSERIHCLFRGFVWVRVFSRNTQPPILIQANKTVFE
jgi:hypothetical protein